MNLKYAVELSILTGRQDNVVFTIKRHRGRGRLKLITRRTTRDGQVVGFLHHLTEIRFETVVQDKYAVIHSSNISLQRNDNLRSVRLVNLHIECIRTRAAKVDRNTVCCNINIGTGHSGAVHVAKLDGINLSQIQGCNDAELLTQRTVLVSKKRIDIRDEFGFIHRQSLAAPLVVMRTGRNTYHHLSAVLISFA